MHNLIWLFSSYAKESTGHVTKILLSVHVTVGSLFSNKFILGRIGVVYNSACVCVNFAVFNSDLSEGCTKQ